MTVIPARSSGVTSECKLAVDEEEAGSGVAQDGGDLGRIQAGVDGDEDAAGGGDGEVRLDHRRDVGAEEGDAVRRPQAMRRAGRRRGD